MPRLPDRGTPLTEAADPGLGDLLVRAGLSVGRVTQRAAAEHDLSPTALAVLGVLARVGRPAGSSHREVAGHLRVTPATLTPVVDALERAGLLTRARDAADRRVVRLSITERGQVRGAAAEAAVAAELRGRLPIPDPAEERILRRYLLDVLAAEDP